MQIQWSIRSKTYMPILNVTGIITENVSINILEKILLTEAVQLIEKSAEFNGIPMQNEPPKLDHKATIYFSLIFKSIKDLNCFVKSIK